LNIFGVFGLEMLL